MNGRMAVIALAVLLVAAIAAALFIRNQKQGAGNVSAYQARITLEDDQQQNLTEIDRESSPMIYFRVTLKDVPLGETLALDCEWIAPDGQVAHRNHYETKPINHDNWNTHCRDRFGPASPTGAWTVTMSLQGRQIAKATFLLRANSK